MAPDLQKTAPDGGQSCRSTTNTMNMPPGANKRSITFKPTGDTTETWVAMALQTTV